MATSPEYDAMLARKMAESEKKRGHTHTQLTEAETQAEIERIQDGAKSSFEGESSISVDGKILVRVDDVAGLPTFSEPKKRRGRPPGSKTKKKNVSAS